MASMPGLLCISAFSPSSHLPWFSHMPRLGIQITQPCTPLAIIFECPKYGSPKSFLTALHQNTLILSVLLIFSQVTSHANLPENQITSLLLRCQLPRVSLGFIPVSILMGPGHPRRDQAGDCKHHPQEWERCPLNQVIQASSN